MPADEVVELTGWGRTSPSAASVAAVHNDGDVVAALTHPPARGVIPRGLGRSYGDAAQVAGGLVIDDSGWCELDVDAEAAVVRASAGTSLDDVMRAIVPKGLFVPVTPGTRQVTVGGAIAADIHGKNHHRVGSWCSHVEKLTMALPNGEVATVSAESDPELFWATAGGMGLTGVVLDATFRCPRIETSRLAVDTDRTADLDEALAIMEATDHDYDYSVAWIDLLATGASMGRSVLTRGRFALPDELARNERAHPLAFHAGALAPAPPWAPNGLLNPITVRLFNEFWYRKAPARRHGEIQTISQFFHPLDIVVDWNRLYGPRGFVQWQPVVPFGEEAVLRTIVERLANSGCPSFLAVLKRFGPGNPGPLSFPAPGWTLAVDIPAGVTELDRLLDDLDDLVADAGGRVYLAKDSRMRSEMVPRMYPRLDEWRAVKARVDPDGILRSDLSTRLRLAG